MLDITNPQQILDTLMSRVSADMSVEDASAFVADDCVIREADSLPYGGTFHGPAGFVHLVKTVTATWGGVFTFDIKKVWTDNVDRMIQLSEITGSTEKGSFAMPMVENYIIRDGKITEITILYFDTKELVDLLP